MQKETQSDLSQSLLNDLKKILLKGVNTTQETISLALEAKGHRMNQSKVSRLLRKVNAIKYKNDQGEMAYRLSHDATPPPISTTLAELVIDVVANESMIIIKTSPGSASLIARILDNKACRILGTLAGDDSIFVAPESIKTIDQTMALIRLYLGFGA